MLIKLSNFDIQCLYMLSVGLRGLTMSCFHPSFLSPKSFCGSPRPKKPSFKAAFPGEWRLWYSSRCWLSVDLCCSIFYQSIKVQVQHCLLAVLRLVLTPAIEFFFFGPQHVLQAVIHRLFVKPRDPTLSCSEEKPHWGFFQARWAVASEIFQIERRACPALASASTSISLPRLFLKRHRYSNWAGVYF